MLREVVIAVVSAPQLYGLMKIFYNINNIHKNYCWLTHQKCPYLSVKKCSVERSLGWGQGNLVYISFLKINISVILLSLWGIAL